MPLDPSITVLDADGITALLTTNSAVLQHAQASGDMYHVKAAQTLFPSLKVILYGMNDGAGSLSPERLERNANMFAAYYQAGYVSPDTRPAVYFTLAMPSKLSKKAGTGDAYEFFDTHHRQPDAAPKGLLLEVGGCTTLISRAMIRARAQAAYRARMQELREGMAPASKELLAACRQELSSRGFQKKVPYLLINYRESGHQGGAHPELDTGFANLALFADMARELGFTPVFMGEQPQDAPRPHLLEYWTANCLKGGGRAAEAAFLRVLQEEYDVRFMGMRSGVTDLVALLGIPTLSIDYDAYTTEQRLSGRPERFGYEYGAKDQAVDHTWARGLKLEAAFLRDYARVFFRDPRVKAREEEETVRAAAKREKRDSDLNKQREWLARERAKNNGVLPHWLRDMDMLLNSKGEKLREGPKRPWNEQFSEEDLERIQDAVRMFFCNGTPGVRHESHPLHPDNVSSDPEQGRMSWVAARASLADLVVAESNAYVIQKHAEYLEAAALAQQKDPVKAKALSGQAHQVRVDQWRQGHRVESRPLFQELRSRHAASNDALLKVVNSTMALLFNNLAADLGRGKGLKDHVPGDLRQRILSYWRSIQHDAGLLAGRDAPSPQEVLEASDRLRTLIRAPLFEIEERLREVARAKPGPPKDIKQTLNAYANRVRDLDPVLAKHLPVVKARGTVEQGSGKAPPPPSAPSSSGGSDKASPKALGQGVAQNMDGFAHMRTPGEQRGNITRVVCLAQVENTCGQRAAFNALQFAASPNNLVTVANTMANHQALHALGPMRRNIDDYQVRTLLDAQGGRDIALLFSLDRINVVRTDPLSISDDGEFAVYAFVHGARRTLQAVVNTHANAPIPLNAQEAAQVRSISHYIAVQALWTDEGALELAFADSLVGTHWELLRQLGEALSARRPLRRG